MKTILTVVVIVSLLAVSCQPITKIAVTYCPNYKSESFEREQLSQRRIIILPMTCDSGLENQLMIFEKEISSNVGLHFGHENVVESNEVTETLHKLGQVSEFVYGTEQIRLRGTIQKDFITLLGSTFDVEYLLTVHLMSVSELKLPKSVTEVNITSNIWSAKHREIVWSGGGGYISNQGATTELLKEIAREVSNTLGNAVHNGPCENREEVIRSVGVANRNTRRLSCLAGILILPLVFVIVWTTGWGS